MLAECGPLSYLRKFKSQDGERMQKIEFLVWTGKQFVLNDTNYLLDSIEINHATVRVYLKPKEPETKTEPKKP